jgi:hypothetical protein
MSEPCRCERADAITSLVAISRIVEKVSAERDEAMAKLARVEAVCVTGTRVATERVVSGSLAHVAAKDAIDTFAKAIRIALEPTQPKGTKP